LRKINAQPAPKRVAAIKAPSRAVAQDERYDANIDLILRSAAAVFAEKSFGLASIRDIAARAKISFPRIYYYLRNKEELLYLISRRAFEQLVSLAESRMLVATGIGVTAGAALGHLDLTLWLIRKASPELATLVSRYLLADIRSLQAPYIIPNHLALADPLMQRFERWARDHLKEGFSLQDAAGALATSARTLQRRCQEVLGKSPLAYFQNLRVERAQSLLHGSGLDLEAIAAEVGYVDGATLRTLLRQRLGRGVRELRADLR